MQSSFSVALRRAALRLSPTPTVQFASLPSAYVDAGPPGRRRPLGAGCFKALAAAPPAVRLFGSAAGPPAFDHEAFTEHFLAAVDGIPTATDPAQSSALLRDLVRTGLLKYTDMADAPEKFFLAHRLLSSVGLGGFGVRFTVQFNLFAGSLVGLAGDEQIKMLPELQESGELGCFLLTEMQAGVLSGLIVETTADWDPESRTYRLHTPSDKAAKNWISQGYTAELGVVVARLRVGGTDHGPHAFHMRLRDATGALLPGIRIEDMGTKTVANDLDNARVWFDNVGLPEGALLNKFCDVVDDEYVQIGDEPMRIEVIGQRLLTGRQCIAEAALVCAKGLHQRTEAYAATKVCNGLGGETTLLRMPQVAAVFAESEAALDGLIAFTAAVEDRLSECLRAGTIPSDALVDAISVCKIRCIDVAIQRVHALRQEVGSYALMHETGFELVDMLLCCKFAEGDSRILQQKLTRDRLKQLRDAGAVSAAVAAVTPGADRKEAMAALTLGRTLGAAGRDRQKLARAMDENWRAIYSLADLVSDRIIRDQPGSAFPEPIVDRMRPASTEFDKHWKSKLL